MEARKEVKCSKGKKGRRETGQVMRPRTPGGPRGAGGYYVTTHSVIM